MSERVGGLKVNLRPGEAVTVGQARITVEAIDARDGRRVRLAIEAPPEVRIGQIERRPS